MPATEADAWFHLSGLPVSAAEAGLGAAQAMLERETQATLRAWQAHLAAAALIFVQARRASLPLSLPCHSTASPLGSRA